MDPSSCAAVDADDEEIRALLVTSSPSSSSSELAISRSTDLESATQHVVKMSIFSVSGNRLRSKERRSIAAEADFSTLKNLLLWVWDCSRYSGRICVVLSSLIYGFMGLLVQWFSASSIHPFQMIFIRCTVILVASITWIKKSGQPLFGAPYIRHLLVARAITGYLSLLGFYYSIHVLHLHDAIVINFTTPLMAAFLAIFLLDENLSVIVVGGLLCSFLGIFLIYQPVPFSQGTLEKKETLNNSYISLASQYRSNVLIALFSALIGGAKYCFIRGAAKASEQPVATVFAFAVFSCPAAAICMLSFQQVEVPAFFSFIGNMVVGLFAFFAEVLLARGLQLETTSKVVSLLFFQGLVSYVLGAVFLGEATSIVGFVGASIIGISTIVIVYFKKDEPLEL